MDDQPDGCEFQVPASALATPDYSAPSNPDEDRADIQPEVGDPVDFSVKGTVKSIDGAMATIHVAFVNGKRVAQPEDEAAGAAEQEPDEDDMMAMAQKADKGAA